MASGNPLLALARCAIGAPIWGVMAEIIAGDKTSTWIKAAGFTAILDPVLGIAIAGIGALVAPAKLYVDEVWKSDWGNKTVMIPWGIEKGSVPTFTCGVIF